MPPVRPTAKSLILDLLGTVGRRAVPVGALLRSAALFGIEPNAARVALARLRAAGLVESDARSLYRLGTQAREVSQQVRSWRRIAERVRPWEGGWLAVHTGGLGRSKRSALHRRQRALRFLGFRPLEPGLEIRPDNLRNEGSAVATTRARLHALGLEPDAPVFELRGLDPGSDARARELWDAADLRRAYRAQIVRLHSSATNLSTLPRDQAMVESFLLGGAAIRELAYDPLLPDEIVPTQERDMLVATLLHYDELGRGCWAGALELDDQTAPADVRGFDAVGALTTAEGI